MSGKKKDREPSERFEDQLERLEEIVARLEDDTVGLEQVSHSVRRSLSEAGVRIFQVREVMSWIVRVFRVEPMIPVPFGPLTIVMIPRRPGWTPTFFVPHLPGEVPRVDPSPYA